MLLRLLTLVFLLCAVPAAAQETTYSIRSGDRITVRLFTAAGDEVQVVNDARIVDPDGDLFLPYVGTVHVAGLNEASLRELLSTQYSEFYDQPVIDIRVELHINVTGSVGAPGQYYLNPTSTVLDAMTAAGGTSSEYAVTTISVPADPTRVRLIRDGELIILNLRPEEVDPTVLEMTIRSGDWYHVPSRERSRIRDEITFWGSVVSFASSAIALVILIGR